MPPPIATREDLRDEFRWLVRDALADEVRELGSALRRDVQHELQSWYKGHNGVPLQCNEKSNGPIMTVFPSKGIDEELDRTESPHFMEDVCHGMHQHDLDLPGAPGDGLRDASLMRDSPSPVISPEPERPSSRQAWTSVKNAETRDPRKQRRKVSFVEAESVEASELVFEGRLSSDSVDSTVYASQNPTFLGEPTASVMVAGQASSVHSGMSSLRQKSNSSMMVQSLTRDFRGSEWEGGVAGEPAFETLRTPQRELDSMDSEIIGGKSSEIRTLRKKWGAGELSSSSACMLFVKTDYFDYIMGSFVMLNAVFIGVQVDHAARHNNEEVFTFRIIDGLFCIVFVSELLLRCCTFKLEILFNKDRLWNLFDMVVVSFQVIDELAKLFLTGTKAQETIDAVGVLRMLRLARILRLVRMVRLVPELKSMVYLIFASMGAFLWTVALLLILIYCVAVYYTEVCSAIIGDLEYTDEVGRKALQNNFGSMNMSMYSLFQAITGGDDWRNFVDPFSAQSDATSAFNRWTFGVYIAFASLVMLNLVTGVFVEGAQRMIQEEKDAEINRSVKKLFNLTDVDMSGEISYEEFEASINNRNISEVLRCLDLQLSEARKLFSLLDVDKSGNLDVREFIMGCMRLKGNARSYDVCTLRYDFDSFRCRLEARFHDLEQTAGVTMEGVNSIRQGLFSSKENLENQLRTIMQSAIVHVSECLEQSLEEEPNMRTGSNGGAYLV